MKRWLFLYFVLILVSLALNSLLAQEIKPASLSLIMRVERTPVNYHIPTIQEQTLSHIVKQSLVSKERVVLHFYHHHHRIIFISGYDTLSLILHKKFHNKPREKQIYYDVLHNNQPYYVYRTKHPQGKFFYSFSPVADSVKNGVYCYRNKQLYAINIQSL